MYTGPDSIHGLGEIWRVAWYGSRINTDRFPERAPKEQAFRGTLPMEIVLDLGFLSYSDNIFTDCMCKLFSTWKAFNFFCFFNLLWKIWPRWIHAKVQAVFISPWLLIWSSFYRLIQSKVLMLVKLSLLVCMCVCFFFCYFCKLIHSITSDQRWTNWDSRGVWTRSKSIPSLDTVWPRSTGPIISDILLCLLIDE